MGPLDGRQPIFAIDQNCGGWVDVRPNDLAGKIGKLDSISLAQNLGSLDHVDELSDISGPIVAFERGQGLIADFPVFSEEPVDKQSHISGPLGQPRQFQAEDIDAIEKIFTEPAGLHLLLQIPIRGRQQPDINAYFLQ